METFTPRVMNPVLHWMILVAVADIWHGSASPTISPNVSTVTVNSGDRVTFLCSGNSSVKWVGVENATRVKVYADGTLSISKALCKDIGIYKCAYVNNIDVEPAFIYLSVRGSHTPWCLRKSKIGGTEDRDVLFPCLLANPEVSGNITLLKDYNDTISSGISFNAREGIRLHKVNMYHRGSYQCQALIQGQWLKSPEMSLTVEKIYPVSVIVERKEYVRIKGEPFNVTCRVSCDDSKYSGVWIHLTANRSLIDTGREMSPEPSYRYTTEYILFIPAVQFNDSGKYICFGQSTEASNFSEVTLHVTEKGFVHLSTIQKTSYEIKLHGSLDLLVLVEAYPSLLQWKWTHTNPSTSFKNFTYSDQMSSVNHRSNNTLELLWLEEKDSGMYTFFAENSVSNASITFNITMKIPPKVIGFQNSSSLSCQATGYPAPHIQWYKLPRHHRSVRCSQGGILLMKDTRPQIMAKVPFGKVSVESTLDIGATESNVTFCCLAANSEGNESYIFTSVILGGVFSNATYDVSKPVISACVGTVVLLLLFIIFLLYKYKQKPKYQVRWKIIEACEGNNYIFIDPTQLPYNEKWEFPRNNLKFGKILGAGAFGKVVEATAFGLGKEDSNLKVAVKMLKSTAHTDEQEALISELKIMSHLGHHENIVNLLGACTHGGPVLVITEYCPYGDLLNFLRKKAEEAFTIQDVNVESFPQSLATDYKNIYLAKKYVRSDSGFGNHSVDHYLEMKPVTTSVSMQAKESTAETEDSHPLSIHDLLQFSNQVAEGMSFLASKNCIHRDLAARNVLLADGRVAKICDFGLARDIMNDANYVVKGNARLPVKWMAPESIFECVYTVQSDVWSYGILLWEIFSLGRSPYPGMKVNGDFYRMVKQGYHMGRPDFAPEFMYNIMKACWNLEPTKRPTFSQICSFIEKQLAADKEQDYRNLPREERDSGCEEASFCEESCESVESKQPLLNSNNYQFC